MIATHVDVTEWECVEEEQCENFASWSLDLAHVNGVSMMGEVDGICGSTKFCIESLDCARNNGLCSNAVLDMNP